MLFRRRPPTRVPYGPPRSKRFDPEWYRAKLEASEAALADGHHSLAFNQASEAHACAVDASTALEHPIHWRLMKGILLIGPPRRRRARAIAAMLPWARHLLQQSHPRSSSPVAATPTAEAVEAEAPESAPLGPRSRPSGLA